MYREFDPDCWHITIIAPDISEMQVLIDDLKGLDIRYVPVEKKPSFAAFSLRIARELLRNKYDLVHTHGFTSGICASLPAKFSRTTHLMTSHDVVNGNQFVGIKGKLKKRVMETLFSTIDTIHSVSHDAQKNLHDHFPSLAGQAGKCVVILNGIEVERFELAAPRNLRCELGVGDNVFLVGFLGRFMSQKGFRYLVDAIEEIIQDSGISKRPLVVTFGDGGFIREEKQAIKGRGLDNYFLFLPFTPNVAGTMKGLDVIAMPSLWEACPLQPMESLVCGTPFVGTDCIGLREVLYETPATVIPKADSSSLALALLEEMAVCRRDEFMAFRKIAAVRFDVKSTRQALLQLYMRMIH